MKVPPLKVDLGAGGTWRGFVAMAELGGNHILTGTDHLLFLLILLLSAPLAAGGGRLERPGERPHGACPYRPYHARLHRGPLGRPGREFSGPPRHPRTAGGGSSLSASWWVRSRHPPLFPAGRRPWPASSVWATAWPSPWCWPAGLPGPALAAGPRPPPRPGRGAPGRRGTHGRRRGRLAARPNGVCEPRRRRGRQRGRPHHADTGRSRGDRPHRDRLDAEALGSGHVPRRPRPPAHGPRPTAHSEDDTDPVPGASLSSSGTQLYAGDEPWTAPARPGPRAFPAASPELGGRRVLVSCSQAPAMFAPII